MSPSIPGARREQAPPPPAPRIEWSCPHCGTTGRSQNPQAAYVAGTRHYDERHRAEHDGTAPPRPQPCRHGEPRGEQACALCRTAPTRTRAPEDVFMPGRDDPADFHAASMNAVGSPTGRVTRDAPTTSVTAARRTDAATHRDIILAALREARNPVGLTSIEAAAILPRTRQGGPQVSNRSASRLGELWEEGHAAVLREHGTCRLGTCHEHDKPTIVHRPTAPCREHGRMMQRGGAAIWVALD